MIFKRNLLFIFLYVKLLYIKQYFCFETCKPKIAVIGAGIGGASSSHFLTELFNKNVEIDIFEANTIGGRLATIKLGTEEYEAGGSIIHPNNKYMKDFIKLLNLSPRPPLSGRFSIWNGKEFVLEESDWKSITLLRLLYRYGLDPYYLHKHVEKILTDFGNIYDIQDKRIAFENVTSLLSAMNQNFINLLQTSIKDNLTKLGFGSRLIDELVKSTLVVNYGQDTDIQAFVGYVSVAGAGYDLWSVKGGNKEVPIHLIKNNKHVSVIHSTVEKIHRFSKDNIPKYEIFYKEKDKEVSSRLYDIVIIATPMTNDQGTQIKFDGFDNTNFIFLGEYQTTVATFVEGNINSSYFGMDEELEGILSCDPTQTIISSIGKLSSVEGKKSDSINVWKIFSRQKLSNTMMNNMFSHIGEIKEIIWKAYPRYSSAMRVDKFKIDDYMYHVNAIEWAASAMEMSAISGRNAAILAYNDYQRICSSSTINNNFGHVSFVEETATHLGEL